VDDRDYDVSRQTVGVAIMLAHFVGSAILGRLVFEPEEFS
jgi:hypothetical protein